MLDFFIIGAQKSASTSLHQQISSHPGIYMPKGEVRFFEDPDYCDSVPSAIEDIVRQGHGRKVGIKRPDYLARPEVPGRIRKHSPDARLIAVLRNPVDRAISAYFHQMKLGFLPVLPLNEGLQLILNGGAAQSHPKSAEIIEYGFYAKHVERYLQVFPREQLLVVLDLDIRAGSRHALDDVFRHIGVTPLDHPVREKVSNPGVYSLFRLSFINLRNRIVFRYDDTRTRLYRRSGFWGPLCNALIIGFDRFLLARICSNRRPLLSPEIHRKLMELYLPDILQLETLLKRDLSVWVEGH